MEKAMDVVFVPQLFPTTTCGGNKEEQGTSLKDNERERNVYGGRDGEKGRIQIYIYIYRYVYICCFFYKREEDQRGKD